MELSESYKIIYQLLNGYYPEDTSQRYHNLIDPTWKGPCEIKIDHYNNASLLYSPNQIRTSKLVQAVNVQDSINKYIMHNSEYINQPTVELAIYSNQEINLFNCITLSNILFIVFILSKPRITLVMFKCLTVKIKNYFGYR